MCKSGIEILVIPRNVAPTLSNLQQADIDEYDDDISHITN